MGLVWGSEKIKASVRNCSEVETMKLDRVMIAGGGIGGLCAGNGYVA